MTDEPVIVLVPSAAEAAGKLRESMEQAAGAANRLAEFGWDVSASLGSGGVTGDRVFHFWPVVSITRTEKL